LNPPASIPLQTRLKLEQIMQPAYPLCREDVVWMLDLIKKKVAEEDPHLLDLSQPRLIKNFRYFAEVAMMLIHRRHLFDQETDDLRAWLREAAYGIIDLPPEVKQRAATWKNQSSSQ
jgi:hypothetical protein